VTSGRRFVTEEEDIELFDEEEEEETREASVVGLLRKLLELFGGKKT
jgi:hypothetical protein